MTCENCAVVSLLRAEFAEVKTDVKLIIRLISMLLADSSARSVSIPPPNNDPPPNIIQTIASAFSAASSSGSMPTHPVAIEQKAVSLDSKAAALSSCTRGNEQAGFSAITVTSEEVPMDDGLSTSEDVSFGNDAQMAMPSTSNHALAPIKLSKIGSSSKKNHHNRRSLYCRQHEMVCVGDDPSVELPMAKYNEILEKSDSACKMLLCLIGATIPDLENYTFERGPVDIETHPSTSGTEEPSCAKNGKMWLREHAAFKACVAQTIKQFGPFEFDAKVREAIYFLCYNRGRKYRQFANAGIASKKSKTTEDGDAGLDEKFAADASGEDLASTSYSELIRLH